jgi:hypothetical protein
LCSGFRRRRCSLWLPPPLQFVAAAAAAACGHLLHLQIPRGAVVDCSPWVPSSIEIESSLTAAVRRDLIEDAESVGIEPQLDLF